MNLFGLFPIPVAKFNLGREFTAEEIKFFYSQSLRKNQGNDTSNNNYVLKDPILTEISSFIQTCLDEYVEKIYEPKNPPLLRTTQSWLNYTKKGQYHHKHNHSNSFISGVLYIKADGAQDKIHFYSDRYSQINLTPKEWNLYNSETWYFSVVTGDIFLFPSQLTHSVQIVETDERISLAFNTFPTGILGDDKRLTELNIRSVL